MASDLADALDWQYRCVEINGWSGAIPADLNFDTVPHEYRSRFNVVTNFGTTEHIINQVNAMRWVHDLACVDGLIFHHVPGGGYFSHGFFSYTLGFFKQLASANDYETLYTEWRVAPDHRQTVFETFGDRAQMPRASAEAFVYVDASGASRV